MEKTWRERDGFYTILGTLVLDDTGDVFEFKSTGTVCDVPESMVGKTACVSGILGRCGHDHFCGRLGKSAYSIAAFFIGMLLAGGDGVLKTVTVCVMFSSLTFAYNAWIDSFFGAVLEELPFDFYAPSRLFFAAVLFLVTKYFAPEKDYELSPALWKLLLEVSLIPLGIVVVVVLGSPVDTNRIPNPTMYVILLSLRWQHF